MSLTASAHSIPGTLRNDVVVDGRFHLVTDEPPSLGGEDTGPAPHELLPAALASCVSTTILMYARTKGWELGEVQVDVTYDHRATPRRMEIDVSIAAYLEPEQLARLEKVAASCPIRQALTTGFEFAEHVSSRGTRALPEAA